MLLAFDTETYRIETGNYAPQLVCITWASEGACGIQTRRGDGYTWHGTERESTPRPIEEAIRLLLGENELIAHNAAYDMSVILETFPRLAYIVWDAYEQNRVKDTMLRAKLDAILDGTIQGRSGKRPKFSLAYQAKKHLGVTLNKGEDTWRLRYSELAEVPLDHWPVDAISYAVDDAVTDYRLFKARESIQYPDEWLQVRGAFALYLMTCRGMETDQDRVRVLRERLTKEIAEIEPQLYPLIQNGKMKLAAVREAVEKAYYPRKPPTADSGAVSYSAETLTEADNEQLSLLAKRQEISKTLSTFVPILLPLIHPSFDSLVSTGRTSCFDPNLQNLPATAGEDGVRGCFRARDGFLYAQADVSRAELCGFSEVCYAQFGCSGMGDILRAGKDPHTALACVLLGIPESSFDKENPVHKNARHVAKIGNFGYLGLMMPRAFVKHARGLGVHIDEQLARMVRESMFSLYPELPLFFQDVQDRGYPHFRTQHKSGRVRGYLTATEGCNTQFQGLVADAKKEAVYELQFACRADKSSVLYQAGCFPVLEIHDELISEVPESRGAECLSAMETVIRRAFRRWITQVPIETEGRLMKYWTK